MFCTSCGKQIADGSLFCTACGSKLDPVEQTKAVNEQAEAADAGSVGITGISVNQDVPRTVAPVNAPAASVAGMSPSQPRPTVNATPIVSAPSIVPPKKSGKGIIMVIGAIAVVVILILLLGKGSGGYTDYKLLVKDYYNAVYKNDSNAVIKTFDKDIQIEMKDYKDDIKDTVDTMKTDWDDQYDKGWNKLVEVAGRVANTDAGKNHYIVQVQLDGGDFDTLYIKKVDSKYYIDEENSPLY